MGNLREAIMAEKYRPRRGVCGIATLLKDLDPEDQVELEEMLNESPQIVGHMMILRGLQKMDLSITLDPIKRHRSKQCSCFDDVSSSQESS